MKYHTQQKHDMCAIYTEGGLHIGWALTTINWKWAYTVVNYKHTSEKFNTRQEAIEAMIDHYHRLNAWVNAPKSKAVLDESEAVNSLEVVDDYALL